MPTPITSIAETWVHATSDIPSRGLEMRRAATEAERETLARSLDILALDRLEVDYRIIPRAAGRFVLEGSLLADVVQSCVVTLEPVHTSLEDRIEVEFRPDAEARPASGLGEEMPILDAQDYEVIEHNRLDVGRIVCDSLAAALPAYPRRPGAALEHREAGPADPAPANPFAALADWKPRKE